MEEKETVKRTTFDYIESLLSHLIIGAAVITALILGCNSCQRNEENEMIKDALIEVLKERMMVSQVTPASPVK